MKKRSYILIITFMISCIFGCGDKKEGLKENLEGDSKIQQNNIVAETAEYDGVDEATKGDIRDRVQVETYVSYSENGGGYLVNFDEYPDHSSGAGKIERLSIPTDNNGYIYGVYLAAGNYNPVLHDEEEMNRLSKIQTVTDIPKALEDIMFDTVFSEVEDDASHRTDLMNYEKTEFTEITNVGEINGYETCRYTGKTTWYDYINDDYSVGTFVGYCTRLNSNGNPFFATAMHVNRKEEPISIEQLDAYALKTYSSMYEITEEEQDLIFGF